MTKRKGITLSGAYDGDKVTWIIEKRAEPPSNYAVTVLYFTLTARHGLQSGSPEEIAFEQGCISRGDLLRAAEPLGKNACGAYLRQIAGETK